MKLPMYSSNKITQQNNVTVDDWDFLISVLKDSDTLPISAQSLVDEYKSSNKRQRKTCSMKDCSKLARLGGKCINHGGVKQCSVEGCSRSVRAWAKCFRHQ